MSGVFDKKADGASRRYARAQKESKEKRKVRIISVSVIAVLAILFAGALFVNSRYIRRTLPAITIGGVNFSAAEFDYFYYNAYHEYRGYLFSELGEQMAMTMLPDTNMPFSRQTNPSTGELWSETFIEFAISNMSDLVRMYLAATEAGFTLSDEKRAELDDEIEMMMFEASMYGFATLDSYLQQIFGGNMTEAVFRAVTERVFLVNEFSLHYRDSLRFTPGQLEEYYSENRDTLDLFTYRRLLVRPEPVDPEEFEEPEELEEANAAAMEEAIALAARIAAGINSEAAFIEAARELSEFEYPDESSTLSNLPGTYINASYADWMYDPGRAHGDVETVEMSFGVYVLFFVDRDPNEYQMVSMRQIRLSRARVNPDEFFDAEDDPEYIAAVEAADAEARQRAEYLLALFIEEGANEQVLLRLMEEYTDDFSTEGGLFEDISKDISHFKMFAEIEAWLFEPGRVYGDFALIRTESVGYHLLFFMDHGEIYREFVAGNRLRDRDHRTWREGLDEVEVVRRWAFTLTQQ